MDDVLILCPTRRQPEVAKRLLDAVESTSDAFVALYADDDIGHEFMPLVGHPRLRLKIGERLGPAKSSNALAAEFPARIYVMGTDDAIPTAPGWDEYLKHEINGFPGRIGVVSAHHGRGDWVNFPAVSREWIQTLGWFAWPGMWHLTTDTVIQVLGEDTRLVRAEESEFAFVHEEHETPTENFFMDLRQLLYWLVNHRVANRDMLRAAMT